MCFPKIDLGSWGWLQLDVDQLQHMVSVGWGHPDISVDLDVEAGAWHVSQIWPTTLVWLKSGNLERFTNVRWSYDESVCLLLCLHTLAPKTWHDMIGWVVSKSPTGCWNMSFNLDGHHATAIDMFPLCSSVSRPLGNGSFTCLMIYIDMPATLSRSHESKDTKD